MNEALVTGGTGFIGGHIVNALERREIYNVTIADVRKPDFVNTSKFVEMDVRGDISLPPKEFDVVFHCAGLLGTETLFNRVIQALEVNIIGTVNILEWAKIGEVFVVQPCLIGEWHNVYMITKHCAENFGFMYRDWFGVSYLSIRPTDVFGQRQSLDEKKAAPTFIKAAIKGEPLVIYGNGKALVNYVFVKDLAEYMIDQYEGGVVPNSPIHFFRPGGTMTVLAFAKKVIELAGSKSEIVFAPMRMGQPADNLVHPYSYLYTEKNPFGYISEPEPEAAEQPKFYMADMDRCLAETIDWYRRWPE